MEETNVQKSVKKRDMNIELLRIIAMLMVITLHAIGNGLLFQNANLSTFNTLLLRFLDTFSLTANGIFLLITGYYLIDKKMNLKKILSLWGRVILYSVLMYIICKSIGLPTDIYNSFLPIMAGQYWFISAYIALYFLSPVINVLANKLNQKQYKYLLIILFIMLGVIRIIFNPAGLFSSGMLPVIMMYLLGGYVKKFVKVKPKQYYFTKYILLTILFVLIYIVLQIVQNSVEDKQLYYRMTYIVTYFREYNNLIIVAMTVLIFLKFKSINIKSNVINKIIALIAPSVFSIYIIHNNISIRDIMWVTMGAQNYTGTWFFVAYLLLLIIGVFIACLLIDLVRRGVYALIKKIPVVNKGIQKINEKIDKVNTKINNIFEPECN